MLHPRTVIGSAPPPTPSAGDTAALADGGVVVGSGASAALVTCPSTLGVAAGTAVDVGAAGVGAATVTVAAVTAVKGAAVTGAGTAVAGEGIVGTGVTGARIGVAVAVAVAVSAAPSTTTVPTIDGWMLHR